MRECGVERGSRLTQANSILGPLGPGHTRLNRSQVKFKGIRVLRLGRIRGVEHPLILHVVLHQLDLPLGSTDPDILLWCEREDRILVSFDKTTLAGHLNNHLQSGHHSPGIFLLRRASRLSQVVAHLALVAHASDAWEWQDRIEFIP